MLRQIYIIANNEIIFEKYYAKGIDFSLFDTVYPQIKEIAFTKHGSEVGEFEFFHVKISYIVEKSLNLLFIFISGITDDFDRLKVQLFRFKKEFLNFFSDRLNENISSLVNDVISPIIDVIHRDLMPKISIIGFSGVGKTTITKLIRSEEIPMKHIPTITGDVATIKFGNLYFFLWDFAGQEQFSFLWNKFIRESDAVLLITDSTLENVEKSRFFLDLIKEETPYAQAAVIANKQDLPNALNIETIENTMDLKTYSMIAIDPENKVKMVRIIADILEINPDTSPLLKPLFERDELIAEAQKTMEQGDYERAVILFQQISNLCLDLGDDSLAIEFHEKSVKLKKLLSS